VTASASTGSGTISGTATATCVAPPPSPGSLDLVKSCDLDLELDSSNKLALKVNYGGSVTNNGTVTLTNVKVCEVQEISAADAGKDPCDIAGATVHTIGTMAGGAVKTYGGAYYPTTALTGAGLSALLNPGSALFKDKVGAQGTLPAILGGTLQKAIPVEANCTLCTP